ncbi:MAG: hypothetical protein HYY40_04955 [Bacteroidetes bacterium]|nr:hypothetical protein [Bacteroidota bacterium]
MKTGTFIILLIQFILFLPKAIAQDAEEITEKKAGNLFSFGIQPTMFRLNYYDPYFFNNPKFKPGIDFTFHYGRACLSSWYVKSGIDIVYAPGKYITEIGQTGKYINETFIRIPFVLVKKFTIDCNDCFMSPSVFVEFGGYYSTSAYQSTYIQDPPTGLSTLEKRLFFDYQKAGACAALGISFLSNNFGRHVLGIRIYSDQWISASDKPGFFQPSYTSTTLFYNLANFNW